MKNKTTEDYVTFKNLKPDEHMFHANNIYSSYYWIEKNNQPIGLVVDVALAE